MHHVLLVNEKHPEILAAGGQHGFVGFEVNAVHHEGAVAEQTQLPLLVQLFQDLFAVLGEIHGCGEKKKQERGETGGKTLMLRQKEPQNRTEHKATEKQQPDQAVH